MLLTGAARNEMLRVVIHCIPSDETPPPGRVTDIAIRACTAIDYIVGLTTLARRGDRKIRDQLRSRYGHRIDELLAANANLDADEADQLADALLDTLTDDRGHRDVIASPQLADALLDALTDDEHLAGRRAGLIIDWATGTNFDAAALAHLVDRAAAELGAPVAYDTLACVERRDTGLWTDVRRHLDASTAATLAHCDPDRWTILDPHPLTRPTRTAAATDTTGDGPAPAVDLDTLTVAVAGRVDTATSRAVVTAIDTRLEHRDDLWDALWLLTPDEPEHLTVAELVDNITLLHAA